MAKRALNTFLLKQVRDAIKKSNKVTGTGFNMASWFKRLRYSSTSQYVLDVPTAVAEYGACNTTACIAGHTVGLAGRCRGVVIEREAQELLGLSNKDAEYLFRGWWSNAYKKHGDDFDMASITKQETVRYLDACIKAGEIIR